MLTKDGYRERLIDEKISTYLKTFGAISIEGPKWCGKTWTALNHANSAAFLNNTEGNFQERRYAQMDVNLVLNRKAPELLDEWQEVPALWDAVRFQCDQDNKRGKYILTGSATPVDNVVHHSGAGRICRVRMDTMSLFETGDSGGEVSLRQLFAGKVKNTIVEKKTLDDLAYYIVRGGWPANLNNHGDTATMIPKSYLNDVLLHDISAIDRVARDGRKMEMLIKSLARNESAIASNTTIMKDVTELDEYVAGDTTSKNTIAEYLDVLTRLHLIIDQPGYDVNIRSRERVGKSAKHHFCDPSLAAAAMGVTIKAVIGDLNTFGLLFEALCEHDLRVYARMLDGKLFHFRDNVTGLEVDAIIELPNGDFGAIEIKLGTDMEDEAAKNLIKFSESTTRAPKFLAVINGIGGAVVRRADGVYSVPITALRD